MYLKWNEQTITDFCDENINSLYSEGYVFTRLGKGIMQQTRSVRIDLAKFELSSENRRVLKKVEGMDLDIKAIPYQGYSWHIGKLAKDFYETKFGPGVFSANKIKELLTDEQKSNFNVLLKYSFPDDSKTKGYAICYANSEIMHYSYPFYSLNASLGMGMMVMAIMAAKQNDEKYIYLGSAQRPTDVYKLQFAGLEWFDGKEWKDDLGELKNILKQDGK